MQQEGKRGCLIITPLARQPQRLKTRSSRRAVGRVIDFNREYLNNTSSLWWRHFQTRRCVIKASRAEAVALNGPESHALAKYGAINFNSQLNCAPLWCKLLLPALPGFIIIAAKETIFCAVQRDYRASFFVSEPRAKSRATNTTSRFIYLRRVRN